MISMRTRDCGRPPNGRNINNRSGTMRLHVWDHFSHSEEAAILIYTHHPTPVFGSAVVDSVVNGNTGVVHQNIQPAVRLHDVIDHSLPVLFLRDVQLYSCHSGGENARWIARATGIHNRAFLREQ